MSRIKNNIDITEKKLNNLEKNTKMSTFYSVIDKLKPFLTNYEGFKVLDVGCRTGFLFDAMKEYGYQNLYGVDISEEAIKILKQRGYYGEVLDIQEQKLEGVFDLIVLRHTLEHTEKSKQVMENCFSMLNEGGVIYVEVPRRSKGKDKDTSHFSWFKDFNALKNILGSRWKILYQQDDFPIIGILKK